MKEVVGRERDDNVYEKLVVKCNRRDYVEDKGLVERIILRLI
jgi:hypothetical protein